MPTYKRKLGKRDYKELLLTQEEASSVDLMESIYNNVPTCGGQWQHEEESTWRPSCRRKNDRQLSLDKLFR
jgi:hypothetical protein